MLPIHKLRVEALTLSHLNLYENQKQQEMSPTPHQMTKCIYIAVHILYLGKYLLKCANCTYLSFKRFLLLHKKICHQI